MRRLLLALALASAAVAVAAGGCTGAVKSGSAHAGRPYDPRNGALGCLHGKGLDARKVGRNLIVVGTGATRPRILFAATSGEAEADHLRPFAAGAEVIGDALLFVGGASDRELTKLEDCLD